MQPVAPPSAIADRPALIRAHVGLRGVAALLVVAYHLQFGTTFHLGVEEATALPRRGYLAVDLFFILSGFIISYVYRADRPAPFTRAEVVRFLEGRFARLYPLLLFSLAAMLALAIVKQLVFGWAGKPSGVDWSAPSLAILASQAAMLNAWIPGDVGWNVSTWSISAEVAAYLLFPWLAALRLRSPRAVTGLALTLVLAFYGAVAATTASLDIIAGLAPLRCLAGFLLGMLLFLGRARIAALASGTLTLVQLLATGTVLALLAAPANDALIVPAFAALVVATWPDRGLVARTLAARPLRWLGDISYSVYLMHIVVIDAVTIVWMRVARALALPPTTDRAIALLLAYAAVLATATLTFNLVERPARQWLARRLTGRGARPITTAPAAP